MDAKKFGTFIASLRKENNMTQADLAKKLQVTDKAISKWERGLGFPDINSIEPLADALGVSILEIMRSEKLDESVITQDTISAALTDTFELVKLQRKAERKSIAKIIGIVASILFLIFLIDGMGHFRQSYRQCRESPPAVRVLQPSASLPYRILLPKCGLPLRPRDESPSQRAVCPARSPCWLQ